MATAFDVDLADIDPEEIGTGGFLAVPGWFHVRLDDAHTDVKHDDSIVLEMVVESGPYKGSKAWLRLKDPSYADDAKQAKSRMLAVAQRLGILTKESVAADKAAGRASSFDFISAIGWTGFAQMVKRMDKSNPHAPVERVDLEYIPLYALTDERVPEGERRKAGVHVPAPGDTRPPDPGFTPPAWGRVAAAPSNGSGAANGNARRPLTDADFATIDGPPNKAKDGHGF